MPVKAEKIEATSSLIYEYTPQIILAKTIKEVLKINKPLTELSYFINETPNPKYGDYGIPIVRFTKQLEKSKRDKKIDEIKKVLLSKYRELIKEVIVSRGYLNIRLNEVKIAELLFQAIKREDTNYGFVKTSKPRRIVIEHTSANPVHPLHIGHARNAVLGDTLARLLAKRGHRVQTRFYVNDLGRQTAVLVYGLLKLGEENCVNEYFKKTDHCYGYIYAVTHTLIDLFEIRKQLEKLREEKKYEEYKELLREQDKLVSTLAKLRDKNPKIFEKLLERITSDTDPREEVKKIMKKYEEGEDTKLVTLVRDAIEKCLKAFQETLTNLDIVIEVWDWESDLAWQSQVKKIIEEAKKTKYITIYKNALALDLEKLLEERPQLREEFKIRDKIPPLILMRSDGTTLYTTRDIAYTLKKYREYKADKVINVIASEQKLEQLQVKLSLIALGYEKEGRNLIHYAYEMVTLPGVSMAGRRGEYITLDELYTQTLDKARQEVEEKGKEKKDVDKVAKAIASGSIRYTLLSTAPSKPIVFDINTALDFNRNSAPYLQYTYARAHNILARYQKPIDWSNIDYSEAGKYPKRELVLKLYQYPYIFSKAADEMNPEILVTYVTKLADIFNNWYQKDPVIQEPDPTKRGFKLALTYSTKTVIKNTLEILGIRPLERM